MGLIRDRMRQDLERGGYRPTTMQHYLACAQDFVDHLDKSHWLDDARALLDTCRQLQLPAALERSRSGNGGHVWLFSRSRSQLPRRADLVRCC